MFFFFFLALFGTFSKSRLAAISVPQHRASTFFNLVQKNSSVRTCHTRDAVVNSLCACASAPFTRGKGYIYAVRTGVKRLCA